MTDEFSVHSAAFMEDSSVLGAAQADTGEADLSVRSGS